MSQIYTLPFNKMVIDRIRQYNFGNSWPVVYLIEDGKEMYIGETTSIFNRSKQHLNIPERQKLKSIRIITDDEYNKSATLDIESLLIQHISADGIFVLQNANDGLSNHNYFDKQKYQTKFEIIWKKLKQLNLVNKDLIQIRNSDLFKYSPYKALTDDQLEIVSKLLYEIKLGNNHTFIINGDPGTGKTILAIYLLKLLKVIPDTRNLMIALVIPMTSLRDTIKKVVKNIKGLKSVMVIGPNEVTNKKYDILIVDEAHRLKKRKNITNYQSFDLTNKKLGLGNKGTELDWILMSSKTQILFYDKNQSIRPSDISHEKFTQLKSQNLKLRTQLRVKGGEEYISYVQDLFDLQELKHYIISEYDFKIYDDIRNMVADIKAKDKQHQGLCRIVSGYAWPWVSKKNPSLFDIEIDGLKLIWNNKTENWVNSKNAINEVGCIHTVQGYDLNYAGVIIGPELSYDDHSKKFIIHSERYMDMNGKRGIENKQELDRYIINIYKTLLTRGIQGTYIYVIDKKLREYFQESIRHLQLSK